MSRQPPPARPRIVQCSRRIGEGGGVSGVAAMLEQGFRAAGYECERVTLESVGLAHRPPPASTALNKLRLLRDVVWYTVAGTLYARLRYGRRDTVLICHNDALVGDIYVNHGLHKLVVQRSPHPVRMLLRNPLHPFLLAREAMRHRLRLHRRVVTLNSTDSRDIVAAYPATRGRVVELGNGVDFARFAEAGERRAELRAELGAREHEVVLLFVGHEYDRKGLYPLLEALRQLDDRFVLWVVGGAGAMVAAARRQAEAIGVAERTRFFGTRRDPMERFFGAADLFVLPSAYEAAQLVLYEAMAAGAVPVVTPAGAAADLVVPGANGYLVKRDPAAIAAAIEDAVADPDRLAQLSAAATRTAAEHDWSTVVARYLDLIEKVYAERRTSRGSRP